MKTTITPEEYRKIDELMTTALAMPNKQSAKEYIDKLWAMTRGLGGAASNVLHDLISYIDNASGRVQDKELKESYCRSEYFKLGRFVEKM